jgi:hypothetical protein
VGGPEKANQRDVHPTTDGRMPPCDRRHSRLEREEGAGDSELSSRSTTWNWSVAAITSTKSVRRKLTFLAVKVVPLATVDKR